MNALFQAQIRYDLTGHPVMIYCKIQEKPFDPEKEMSMTLDAEENGWVDAKQLVATLRRVAEAIEKS